MDGGTWWATVHGSQTVGHDWATSLSSSFPKSTLNIWKFKVHILLKPGLENFQHNFAACKMSADQPWDFFGRNDAKAEAPVLWPPHAKR